MTAATHADHVQARPGTPGAPAHAAGSREPLVRRVRRGRPEDPRWARPAFLAMLLVIALAYLWNLSASGYANSFYSAAVQAYSQSWKAFFFGSLDSANAITVDKPPATLWPMALSVRIFGLSSWAILAPQVLMGVATAGVLYAAVRRRFSAAAGLITMAVFALTPVAALMFRFNNPDALLALLMTATVYCVLRAFEGGRTKWLVWAGVAVGLAFLSKTLQAFLILPPLAVLYAVFAPVSVRKRFGQLGLAALATVVSAGWWVAIVELWPASSRPYIGGSQNNSFLELTFGYNGLGRINGEETGSVGGGGGGGQGGGWGETGIGRMFNSEIGGQISWLLPAALILLVAGVWLTRRAKRTDTARAAFLAWGGSLLMTAFVFSFMAADLPPVLHRGPGPLHRGAGRHGRVGPLGGAGQVVGGRRARRHRRGDGRLVVRPARAHAGLRPVAALGRPGRRPGGAVGLLFAARLGRALALGAVGLGLAASLAGPTAYTISTLNTGHQGSIVTAGPSAGGMGGPGGGMGGGRPPGQGAQQDGGQGMPQGGQAPGNAQGGGFPGGGAPGQGQQGQGQGRMPGGQQGGMPGGGTGEGGGGGGGGGMGGLLDGASVDSEAKTLLKQNADAYTWTAAPSVRRTPRATSSPPGTR